MLTSPALRSPLYPDPGLLSRFQTGRSTWCRGGKFRHTQGQGLNLWAGLSWVYESIHESRSHKKPPNRSEQLGKLGK